MIRRMPKSRSHLYHTNLNHIRQTRQTCLFPSMSSNSYTIFKQESNFHRTIQKTFTTTPSRMNEPPGTNNSTTTAAKTTTSQSNFTTNNTEPKLESSHHDDPYIIPKSFGIGTIAGFAGSLVGMGGGFIMIPLLTMKKKVLQNNHKQLYKNIFTKFQNNMGLGISQHVAHGTSLFAVCATGIAGGIGFGLQDICLESVGALALSGMVTARIGALWINRLSSRQLKISLGVFMICVAPLVPLKPYIAATFSGDDGSEGNLSSLTNLDPSQVVETQANNDNYVDKIVIPGMVGLGSGFISGTFGVGGGAVTVPALTIATDLTHYQALGTSLCAMSLPAMVGTITHYQKGNVALRLAVPLACGAFLGGYTGGKVGKKLPEDKLRWGFFALLLSLGSRNLIKVFK